MGKGRSPKLPPDEIPSPSVLKSKLRVSGLGSSFSLQGARTPFLAALGMKHGSCSRQRDLHVRRLGGHPERKALGKLEVLYFLWDQKAPGRFHARPLF